MLTKCFRIVRVLLVFCVGSAFWILSSITIINVGNQVFRRFVLYPQTQVNVSGTGSMYPTFPRGTAATLEAREVEVVASPVMIKYPNGFAINGKTYFKSNIQYGDIISFNIGDTAYIKRVVALAGDSVEIRNGLVYLNDLPLKEPYTALPHSTFGGDLIAECKKIIVPDNSYFVLGDNRKESNDSRFELGFINENSIHTFLPLSLQKGSLAANWRDTSEDLAESSKIKLDVDSFIKQLNVMREAQSQKKLQYSPELGNSARLRANTIFKTGSFDEKAEGATTISDSIRQSDYWQPIYGEVPVQGYFSASELFNYLTEFPKTKDFILDPDFSEIGVSISEGNFNNCPSQMIVLHFAGYVPPNYEPATIKSWKDLLNKLKEILPGWKEVKAYETFYEENKRDVDKVISIISDRIEQLSPIVAKMQANEWLSEDELDYLSRDAALGDEQESLADKLNKL